jgi:hypothetical protein
MWSTFRPSTERRPEMMHSLRPVPSTMASYSSSIVALQSTRDQQAK